MFLVLSITLLSILYPEVMGLTFWILVAVLVMTINGIEDAVAAPALALGTSTCEAGSKVCCTVENFSVFFI